MASMVKDRLRDWDILLVEDEPDSLEVAIRWLKMAGANILTATNGKEGLELAIHHKPRLVISDLTMPVMDGWELLYELKHAPETQNIPVIALTAHAMKATLEQTIQAGFVAHISKPLHPYKFIDHLMDIVVEVPELSKWLPASGDNSRGSFEGSGNSKGDG